MRKEFYKTKLTVEIEVRTQFGPQDAVNIVRNNLNFAAIEKIRLLKIDTNYVPFTPQDANRKIMENVPTIL